jgi:hypothetical protein
MRNLAQQPNARPPRHKIRVKVIRQQTTTAQFGSAQRVIDILTTRSARRPMKAQVNNTATAPTSPKWLISVCGACTLCN